MKKLSVIVPVYNAEKWIKDALDSLVNQTYPDIEVICVDDGSADGSGAEINKYIEKCLNIRLIKQKNAGVSAARNKGIENAEGEYIAFLDADDYIELDAYYTMIQQLEAEGSDAVFCEFVRFWPNGKIQYTVEENFPAFADNPGNISLFFKTSAGRTAGNTLYTPDIHGSSCRSIYKKSIIESFGIRFYEDLCFAEDQIFVLEYLEHCKKISYCNKPFVWYRGWTKAPCYRNYYSNHMALVGYQKNIVDRNGYYSDKEKRKLKAYLDCTAYFMITAEVFSFRSDAEKIMKEYSRHREFTDKLTLFGFVQKYKSNPDIKRIALFVLLKLRMWRVIKKLYPAKKY